MRQTKLRDINCNRQNYKVCLNCSTINYVHNLYCEECFFENFRRVTQKDVSKLYKFWLKQGFSKDEANNLKINT